MGIENISAARVSEFNRELDGQVEAFRSRLLEEEYAVIWIDCPLPEGQSRGTGRFRGGNDRLRGESGRKSRNPGRGADVR